MSETIDINAYAVGIGIEWDLFWFPFISQQRLSDTENSASDCSEEKSNGDSSDYDPYADYSSNDEDAEQVEVKPKE